MQEQLSLLSSSSGAVFSECREYRYVLWRQWDASKPRCVWIGLNPSTADEVQDDPTIRRCIDFCKSWGFGTYVMLNAYGFRATKPKDMFAAEEPIGPRNDEHIVQECQKAAKVVAAWGVNCSPEREKAVCALVRQAGMQIHCLGTTKHGNPRHPLYLRKTTPLELFACGEPTKPSV